MNLLKSIIITLLAFISLKNTASANPSLDWQWALSATGTSKSIAVDASGNTYITGYFDSPTITFGTSTLTKGGTESAFIAKYDVAGNLIWARSSSGTGSASGPGSAIQNGNSIAVDASGNSYIAGTFSGNTMSLDGTTLTNVGNAMSVDIFIAKYDAVGNLLWVKSAGGTSIDLAYGIAIDPNGNAYITGSFSGPFIVLGSTALINSNPTGTDVFIAKYDTAGNLVWAKGAGGTDIEFGRSIAADASGNTYITGYFSSPTLSFGTTILTNAGLEDIFIAKYDASGNFVWAKNAGGADHDYAFGIAADPNGNSYLTGFFESSTISFGATILTNSGGLDFFIAKYDTFGNPVWAKRAGGTADDGAFCIAADTSGNTYLTGFFGSTISFGATTLTNSGGGDDFFTAKYDTSGNPVWAVNAGRLGTGQNRGSSIAVDANGCNSYITGFFESSLITFGATTLTKIGSDNMFTAKYGTNTTTAIIENNTETKIAVYPNPNKGVFSVQISNFASQTFIIEVFNLVGESVYSGSITSDNTQIDLQSQPNGVYFFKLIGNKGVLKTGKVIVE